MRHILDVYQSELEIASMSSTVYTYRAEKYLYIHESGVEIRLDVELRAVW